MIILPSTFSAAETPVPAKKKDALNHYKSQISKENQAKDNLQKKIKTVQADLATTKNKLIRIATEIQNNENAIIKLETRISKLENNKNELDEKVKTDKRSIAQLISSLQKMRRTPPEALIAQDRPVYEIAQSAIIMRNIIPAINRHAKKLQNTYETLDKVTRDLRDEQKDLIAQSKKLIQNQKQLSGLVKKRQTLHAKIDQDIKIREIAIQKISLQAENLEELVEKIKKEERLEEERRKTAFIIRPTPLTPKQSLQSSKAVLPISGVIRTSYNQTDQRGANSKGITIEGRNASIVLAPMDGKIQFIGPFKRYGNIVIIEHSQTYHSLIAGLDTIHITVGAQVKSGEPIGSLPDSSLNPRPKLYYELRKNGKAVNPAIKFSDLG